MSNDLSLHHGLIGKLFTLPQSDEERDRHRLSTEQVEFFHEFGYLKGIRVLDESQVEALSNELQELVSPQHPRHELFYEFHSNGRTIRVVFYFTRSERGASCPDFTIFCGIQRSPTSWDCDQCHSRWSDVQY
jgi:hypothetical protein